MWMGQSMPPPWRFLDVGGAAVIASLFCVDTERNESPRVDDTVGDGVERKAGDESHPRSLIRADDRRSLVEPRLESVHFVPDLLARVNGPAERQHVAMTAKNREHRPGVRHGMAEHRLAIHR